MSRCTHNDHPGMVPCKNEGVGEGGYCAEHGCCLCGGVMLADTEDWQVRLCEVCLHTLVYPGKERDLELLVDAAFEAGRKAVIGSPLEPDDEVENAR